MPSVNKVIFIDVETTGLNYEKDEVIQVAALLVDMDSRNVLSSITYYIESTIDVPPRVTAINGYHRGKWAEEGFYPVPAYVAALQLHKFFTDNKDAIIFAHNSAFDRAFCSILMNRAGIDPLQQPKNYFDTATLQLLFRLHLGWERVSLDYAKAKLKIEYVRRKHHDALDDCYLLSEVFFKLLDKIKVIE